MKGAIVKGSLSGQDRIHMEFIAGGTFAANDFVKFGASSTVGEIVVGTAGARILGVARKAGTDAGETVSIDITPNMMVLMENDNNGGTFAATDVGEHADFTGGTGAMVVNTTTHSATKAQLACLKFNPEGNDTKHGLYYVAERWLSEQDAG